METKDAKKAYESAKNDIASLLGFFECELSKEYQTIDWTTTGDLNKVRRNLIETLSFLSSIETDAIEETLEEGRMLAEADSKG